MISQEAEILLDQIRTTEGAEVHSEEWSILEELSIAGLVTVSGPRGPGRQWKRAVPVKPDTMMVLKANDWVIAVYTTKELAESHLTELRNKEGKDNPLTNPTRMVIHYNLTEVPVNPSKPPQV